MITKTIFKVYCSECSKFIGNYENIPVIKVTEEMEIINQEQPYIYECFKEREGGMSYYDIEAFCSHKCNETVMKMWKQN